METAFDRALAWVLRWEGGLSRDPADHAARAARPGAIHTAYGIRQETYDRWRSNRDEPPEPVAHIELADVAQIYRDCYWRAGWCDRIAELPAERLALVHFDGSVQHSVSESTRLLQRTVRAEPDGVPGPATLAALAERLRAVGEGTLCAAYLERRYGLYRMILQRDPGQQRFRSGWRARLNALAQAVGVAPVWPADD